MDLGLKDKVALVTAASKGIGKAIAVEFAKEGATVSICARGPQDLATTARAAEHCKQSKPAPGVSWKMLSVAESTFHRLAGDRSTAEGMR